MEKARSFDRRRFLKLSALAAAGSALPLVSPAIGLASLNGKQKVAQDTRMLMGTLVGVTVVDTSADRAVQALNTAYVAMEKATPLFDRHASSGLLADFNHSGRLSDIPPMLKRVLDLTASVKSMSHGAFDISVAPVLDVYEAGYKAGRLPDRKQIDQALSAVGGVQMDASGIRLTEAGASITLDGVAKGFIADLGIQAAAKAGAKHVLINAGGDVAVLGGKAENKPWRIAVSDPDNPVKAKMVVKLTTGALATSGNYEIYFDRDKLFHHIIDPSTGASPRTDASASVKAPSAAVADALSTTCFVMTPREAMDFLNARPQIEGMIITREGHQHATPGFAA